VGENTSSALLGTSPNASSGKSFTGERGEVPVVVHDGLDAFYIATLEEGRVVEINEFFEDVFVIRGRRQSGRPRWSSVSTMTQLTG